MKRIVLFLILLFPVVACAQFYVSPQLGFSLNQYLHHGPNKNPGLYSSYHMGAKFGYETKIVSFGLGIQSTGARGSQPIGGLYTKAESFGPSVNPYIFIGKNFYFDGSFVGVDLSFGPSKHSSDRAYQMSYHYWGYAFGASVSFNIKVTNKAFITLGVSPSHMVLPVDESLHVSSEMYKIDNKNLTATYIPFHVGATFKF